MGSKKSKVARKNEATVEKKGSPRCLSVFQKGIHTGRDFANGMSALMSDIIDGRVTPAVGNAACNAGGKLLKVVEMQQKYGSTSKSSTERVLMLSDDNGK